jgi:thiol:disulfide interchange protein
MRRFLLFIYLLLSLFLSTVALQGIELDWEHDYHRALQDAKQEHKVVYLFIGADKCRYCKKFKKMTLSKPEVIERMKKDFILLYMSRDQHQIPDGFELYGVPRHYFLTSGGKIIRTEQGIWDPQGWFTILDEVLSERDDPEDSS